MRRVINSTYITLDGAVENPHLWPSLGDAGAEASLEIQSGLLGTCDALLMGRKTYESFASVWPTRAGDAFADRLNAMTKYVASTTLRHPAWNNTSVIAKDLPGEIHRLKQLPGMNILQYGIGPVSFALMEQGLFDEFHLWIHPLVLGRDGPTLPPFRECPSVRLRLTRTRTLANGIVVVSYERC